jgi:hypothetical protein
VWPWDAEDRDCSFLGEADFGDKGLDGGFALPGDSTSQDVGQVGLQPLDDATGRWGGFGADGVG